MADENDIKSFEKLFEAIRDNTQSVNALQGSINNMGASVSSASRKFSSLGRNMRSSNTSMRKSTYGVNSFSQAFRNLTASIKDSISVYNIFKKIQQGILSLWDYWIEKQKVVTQIMGETAMRTGATRAQLQNYGQTITELSSTFTQLTGDPLLALEMSAEAVQNYSNSLRRANLTAANLRDLVAIERGFGLSAEQASELFLAVDSGLTSARDLSGFAADITNLASDLNTNAAVLSQEFLDVRENVAEFGQDGWRAFRDVSMMATRFRVESKKLFEMAKKFDQFESASDAMNQFNSVMGTSLSSFELMMEQDPSKRIEMIRSSLRDAGLEWQNLDRYQIMTLENLSGLSADEAARVFGESASLEDLAAEREKKEKERLERQRMEGDNVKNLNELLSRTNTVFQTWDHWLQQIKDILVDAIGPVFDALWQSTKRTAIRIREFLKDVTGRSSRFREIVEKVRQFVVMIDQKIEQITWENIEKVGKAIYDFGLQAWDVMKKVWPYVERFGVWLWEKIQSGARMFSEFIDRLPEHMTRARIIFNVLVDAAKSVWTFFTKAFDVIMSIGRGIGMVLSPVFNLLSSVFSLMSRNPRASREERGSLEAISQSLRTGYNALMSGPTEEQRRLMESVQAQRDSSEQKGFNNYVFDFDNQMKREMTQQAQTTAPTAQNEITTLPAVQNASSTTAVTANTSPQSIASDGIHISIIPADVILDNEKVGKIIMRAQVRGAISGR